MTSYGFDSEKGKMRDDVPLPPTKSGDYDNTSKLPPSFQTTFASLSLHQFDRIRLLGFPTQITDLMRHTISSSWARGIQNERTYAGSYEFKLKGNPWYGQGDEAMTARRLMQKVLESLWNTGWLLSLSTDVSKKQTDKDTLIFRYQYPPPPACDWMTVSFSRYDRIRFMNMPVHLREAIVEDIRPFVQDSRVYSSAADTWEVKIRGNPWMATGEESMTARLLVLKMITMLERFGYTVYASIDQKATQAEHQSESDTWHCRRQQDWTSGIPVYHN